MHCVPLTVESLVLKAVLQPQKCSVCCHQKNLFYSELGLCVLHNPCWSSLTPLSSLMLQLALSLTLR